MAAREFISPDLRSALLKWLQSGPLHLFQRDCQELKYIVNAYIEGCFHLAHTLRSLKLLQL